MHTMKLNHVLCFPARLAYSVGSVVMLPLLAVAVTLVRLGRRNEDQDQG